MGTLMGEVYQNGSFRASAAAMALPALRWKWCGGF